MMRAIVLFIALVVIPLLSTAQTANLRLLHINDVYEIAPKRGVGGMAQLMTLLKQERAGAEHSLTTLGGDLLSPSLLSGLNKGSQMIDVMNAISLDVAVMGNHEFDFGDEVLKQRMDESKFTWLSTNVLGSDGQPFHNASAYMVRDIGELKLGVFALLTDETTHLSSPGKDLTFVPIKEAAQQAVADLKEQGADFIIALTHLNLADDRELARSVAGIHVILGGHDHVPMTIYEGSTLILKAGYDAHYLLAADIQIEKKESRGRMKVSMLPQWRYLSTAAVEPDTELAAIVTKYEQQLDKELNIQVGTTSVELNSQRASVRIQETTMGNLIADAVRAAVSADVSIANGGGIRGDRTYDAGTTLTRKDILTELPFGNVTVKLEISGADLRVALENGVSQIEDTAGRFPQVSGMRYVFDRNAEAGSRIVDVTIAEQPLVADKTYTLATNDYIANGGDGYAVLKGAKRIIDASGGTLMALQVMNYIAAKNNIAPKIENRIVEKQ